MLIIFWLGIAAAVIIGVFSFMKAKTSVVDPTLKQMADLIDEFLNGTSGPYEWHDFVTHHILKDPNLEKIRKECAAIAVKFPPEDTKAWCSELGKNELLKISERLREESNKVMDARRKSAAEAKARQPATDKTAMGKSPMGRSPMSKSPMGKSPMSKGPMRKGPMGKPPAVNQPMTNLPVGNAPILNVPVLNQPMVNAPVNPQIMNQPIINPSAAPIQNTPVPVQPVTQPPAA